MKGFSRKAQRKQERLDKKQQKNLYFQRRKTNDTTLNNKPKVVDSEPTIPEKPKRKRTHKKSNKSKNNGNSVSVPQKSHYELAREKRFIRDEEVNIKKYEKLLKLKTYTKRNRLPKSFYLDGLGELIEICDRKQYDNRIEVSEDGIDFTSREKLLEKPEEEISSKRKQISDDDDDEDEEMESDEEEEVDFGDEEEEDEEMDDASGEENDEDGEDLSNEEQEAEEGDDDVDEEFDEEDVNNVDDDDDDLDALDALDEDPLPQKRSSKKQLNKDGHYEDIYGFLRDEDGNIVKSNDPNSSAAAKLDALNSKTVVVDEQIQRKLRGLLNRLTADNIKVISNEIVAFYRGNSRAVINQGLMNCIEKTLFAVDYSVPSKLTTELALLVAILYSELGEEIGAFFVHASVCHFDALFGEGPPPNSDSKKLNNSVVFILALHATGLVDSALIYDILDKFCAHFASEKSIEIIDLILKTAGFLLRKEDAVQMKALILNIQSQASGLDLDGLSGSRIRFILDSLTAIKNNNVAKLRVSDPVVLGELIESTLKGLLKKARVPCIPGQYAAVIQSAHWFSFTKTIVPLDEINPKTSTDASDASHDLIANDKKIDFALRDKLCKRLRINTPLRRDLFTVLLQCSDYIDAACKLISVGKKQFSEVINVVLHVAINEKTYNPFYQHLLHHLTTCDRKYKVALDFAIRDKIGQVETLSPSNRTNLAKIIFNLFKANSLTINCLKVVQFSDMNETYVEFMRNILEPLFAQCDDATIESVLSKIPKKDNFANAIKLFITCFMNADSRSKMSSVRQLQFKLKI